jgi:RNA-binding protein YhbY
MRDKVASATMQIGKNGLSDNFFMNLKNTFKNRTSIRISVLRSVRNSREDVKKISDGLIAVLGKSYTSKIIGFTIILKKWRKARG